MEKCCKHSSDLAVTQQIVITHLFHTGQTVWIITGKTPTKHKITSVYYDLAYRQMLYKLDHIRGPYGETALTDTDPDKKNVVEVHCCCHHCCCCQKGS